jgi:hypothetical protein
MDNDKCKQALLAFIDAWEACGKFPDTTADIMAIDSAYDLAKTAIDENWNKEKQQQINDEWQQ